MGCGSRSRRRNSPLLTSPIFVAEAAGERRTVASGEAQVSVRSPTHSGYLQMCRVLSLACRLTTGLTTLHVSKPGQRSARYQITNRRNTSASILWF